jgi:hypothetical protein
MRLPRLCLRTRVLAIALIGAALWCATAPRRWARYRARADYHSRAAIECFLATEGKRSIMALGKWGGKMSCIRITVPPERLVADRAKNRADLEYHARMSRYWESRW